MDPLPVYAEWWSMTEECSGLTGEFSRIEWYVVPGASSFRSGGRDASGIYSNGRIVLAGNAQRAGDLVRHEMLHALLNRLGHPRDAFVARCGGMVGCQFECPDELTAPPDAPGALLVPESQLEITTSVWPTEPSADFLDGYFRFEVSARNPTDKPIIVQLTPPPPPAPAVTFSYRLIQHNRGAGAGELPRFAEMTRFDPGETKRQIYDFWIAPRFGTPLSGIYELQGGYGQQLAAPVTVSIAP